MNKKLESGIPAIRRTLILSTVSAALILLSFSCSPKGASMNVEAPEAGFSSEEGGTVSAVRVVEAGKGEIEERITLSGEVQATGRVNVMPEISGLLTKVLVSPGDTVAYNQVVAYVDPSRPGMSYAESPVRSKASGTVTAVPSIAGNQVSLQSVIAVVGDLESLEVETRVPEKHLAHLEPGMKGRVVSRAYPDLSQEAKVVEISPVVDSRTRTVLVTLKPEPGSVLRPGQAVSVDLVLDTHESAVAVPSSALAERREGLGVFVVDNGKASWRGVAVGTKVDGLVEITSGLDGGEKVVTAGLEEITDGSAVRVVEG